MAYKWRWYYNLETLHKYKTFGDLSIGQGSVFGSSVQELLLEVYTFLPWPHTYIRQNPFLGNDLLESIVTPISVST